MKPTANLTANLAANPAHRSRPSLRPALGAALLPLLFAACSSTGEVPESGPELPDSGSPAADEAGAEDKAHKIEMAQLELDQARLGSEQGLAKAELELMLAEKKLKEDKESLQVFKKSRSRRQAEAQLELDRATGRATDSEAELAELESMYADEEFAEKTKELVLNRGRRNLDHARRGLEIQEQKLQLLVEYELPKEQYGKEMAVSEAEQKLAQSRRGLELARLKGKAAVTKAEYALLEARTAKKED